MANFHLATYHATNAGIPLVPGIAIRCAEPSAAFVDITAAVRNF
jgi:hypothetical protein